VLHGDYRSDHIYFSPDDFAADSEPRWALIDLDGSRVGQPITPGGRHRALLQLTESLLTSGLEESDLAEFLSVYDPGGKLKLRARMIYETAREKAKT
jgi:aminoglycoside phosphotransferase (APT) family kinase protein